MVGPGGGRRRQRVARPTYLGLAQRRQRAGIRMPTGFEFGKKRGLKSPHGPLLPGRAQFDQIFFVAESPANNDPDHWTRSPEVMDWI